MNDTVWAEDAVDAAGGLDLLLTDAALGVWRRFRPDSSLLRLAAELARRPGLVGRQAAQLGTELGRIAAGRSAVAADPRDRRFADPAWKDNPFLRRSVQAYLAAASTAEALVAGAELGWRDDTRLKFLLTNLIAAAAPSNNPLLSPAGWKAVIDTGGENAVRGLRDLASDLATSPRVPSMVPAGAYEVGKDLAVTPGGVVHATDQFELIQYQPVTETVYRYPLLIVPPMINKYYIVDLAPGRSMVEFLVEQGHQVFVMSWRNPDARHRDWNLDTYGGALTEALTAVRAISGAAKASICALCSGGIMTSMVAAHLAVTGQLDQLASLCLGVTVLDQSQAGTAGAFIDEKTAAAAMAVSAARGYLDGRALAEVFAWLRPDDLIWNYWVNNYLQGGRRRPSTSCTGTPTSPGCPPRCTTTSSGWAWPTRWSRPARRPCSARRSTWPRSTWTPTSWRASPTTCARGNPATGPRSCSAGRSSSSCRPAGTSRPWSTRRPTPRPRSGPRRPRRRPEAEPIRPTRASSWPPRPRCRAAGGRTIRPGWPSAAAAQRKSPRTLGRKAYPVRGAAPGTYVHDR